MNFAYTKKEAKNGLSIFDIARKMTENEITNVVYVYSTANFHPGAEESIESLIYSKKFKALCNELNNNFSEYIENDLPYLYKDDEMSENEKSYYYHYMNRDNEFVIVFIGSKYMKRIFTYTFFNLSDDDVDFLLKKIKHKTEDRN